MSRTTDAHSTRTGLLGITLVLALLLAACAQGPSVEEQGAAPQAVQPTTSAAVTPAVTPAATPAATSAATPAEVPTGSAAQPTEEPTEPSPYVTSVDLPPRCLPATDAIYGVKVYLVQQALGLVGHKERYDATTEAAVRGFQADHGLAVDGVVGPLTWAALGIGEPYCVDQYTAQPRLGLGATDAQRIEMMIDYALGEVGTPYIWGGAGPMGFDCSGLALQAMYAAGRTVPGLDANMHVAEGFRSTRFMYDSELPHVPFDERRRGDLIFYGEPITHMAIYLGKGRIVEDVRPVARVAGLMDDGLPAQPLVVRPFPG